jgi:hypothetical protein
MKIDLEAFINLYFFNSSTRRLTWMPTAVICINHKYLLHSEETIFSASNYLPDILLPFPS